MSSHRVPLLPGGEIMFDRVPGRVLMLEAIAPSVGDGAIFVEGGRRFGLAAVRDSVLAETYAFEEGSRTSGDEALRRMQQWLSVEVSAWRLDAASLDILPMLLSARPAHRDLSLAWTSWSALLDDLRDRGAGFVVEVTGPRGRGVTCIDGGRHIATYSDAHPSIGDLSVLDGLAAPDGAVSVWQVLAHADRSADRPTRRDPADALTWYISQKGGDGAEETVITAPFAFHEEGTGTGEWFVQTFAARELHGQVRDAALNMTAS